MNTQSYHSSIRYAATLAPGLDKPTVFIKWADEVSDLLSYIFGRDYENVTEDLVSATKDEQDWEEDE